ncbi:MAG: S-adenosylmethionine decarboxylase proenzyme [Candidatus Anoxychlamydiales bacterium]|nr:S-adenosylmethionine decarboxylase proenzyme [Candidatus Anoxychlamydiales bacterium]
MVDYWGYHLILDCSSCDKDKVASKDNIYKFVKTLVKEIDMKAYKEPIIEHFATHNPLAAGYSMVQLIETSSITGHLVDSNGDAYFDIFSCKPFNIEIVKEVVNIFFEPKKIRVTYLTRQA